MEIKGIIYGMIFLLDCHLLVVLPPPLMEFWKRVEILKLLILIVKIEIGDVFAMVLIVNQTPKL